MAFAQRRCNYHLSFLAVFVVATFLVLYNSLDKGVLKYNGSNYSSSAHGRQEFDKQSSNAESNGKSSQNKELTNKKCKHLEQIAMDMLYNGEKILLPIDTNNTKWVFHERGNLDYLNLVGKQWSKQEVENLSIIDIKSKDFKEKKHFITFACRCCAKSKIIATRAAREPGGFDFTTVHDLDSLSKRFRDTHLGILKQRRGCGFWLWKPYIILKTLIENVSYGDLLMYQDAGAHLIRDAGPLLKLCRDIEPGIAIFYGGAPEAMYSKRDAFILMDMEDARVYQSPQRHASFLVLRKNCEILQFVMEWLAYASDARILTDIKNKMGKPNLPTFRDNRHDQTVLSLLSKKWQLNAYRDPSQFGNTDDIKKMYALGPYKQIIQHTRNKH